MTIIFSGSSYYIPGWLLLTVFLLVLAVWLALWRRQWRRRIPAGTREQGDRLRELLGLADRENSRLDVVGWSGLVEPIAAVDASDLCR